MKARLVRLVDSFLFSNLWFVFWFLDRPWLRTRFFEKYAYHRPDFFETYFRWKPVLSDPRTILIVKNDAIGDYLLFRNFIEEISTEFRPKGYRIFLLGNTLWKSLSEHLDGSFLDGFFWMDRGGMNVKPSPDATRKLILEINRRSFSFILYPNISRETLAGDYVVQHIPARTKIGYDGDTQNQVAADRDKGNGIYSVLVRPEGLVQFEFFRNRTVVESLLGRPSRLARPRIPDSAPDSGRKPYAVFFPGASAQGKQWPSDRFAQLGNWVQENYGLEIVLAGGPGDVSLCESVRVGISGAVENFAGRTRLPELLDLIAKSTLLVSNDTVAIHMGIQLGIPSVCPFKCNHYGRFLPYPAELFPRHRICLPEEIKDLSPETLSARYSQNYGTDIRQVALEEVKACIHSLLGPATGFSPVNG